MQIRGERLMGAIDLYPYRGALRPSPEGDPLRAGPDGPAGGLTVRFAGAYNRSGLGWAFFFCA